MFRKVKQAVQQQNWLALLLELLIVIIGVSVAYQLSVWQNQRNSQQQVKDLMANIHSENQRNYHELSKLMGWYEAVPERLSKLQSFLEEKESPVDSVLNYLSASISLHYYSLNDAYLNRYVANNLRYDPQIDSLLLELQLPYPVVPEMSNLEREYGYSIPSLE